MRRFRSLVYFALALSGIVCSGGTDAWAHMGCAVQLSAHPHATVFSKANNALRVRGCRLQVRVVLGRWRRGPCGLLPAFGPNPTLKLLARGPSS
jgi:hypothetical protein